jgi:hypothetical protein
LFNGLPKKFGELLYKSLCPPPRADEVSGELQLIPALYDEGDSLPLQEQLS